jgi:hypothetical protein
LRCAWLFIHGEIFEFGGVIFVDLYQFKRNTHRRLLKSLYLKNFGFSRQRTASIAIAAESAVQAFENQQWVKNDYLISKNHY